MTKPIILASGSSIRRELLENAGVPVSVMPARIDEDAIRQSLEAEDATPRDVADTLAEILAPAGLTPAVLKAEGRYVEDVY